MVYCGDNLKGEVEAIYNSLESVRFRAGMGGSHLTDCFRGKMAEWNSYYCTVLNYNIHTDMIIFCPEESEAAVSDCLPVHSSPLKP